MSFTDYLHEKAEESRHNETASYLMFLAGAIFLVGGILETLASSILETLTKPTQNPSWLLLIPYSTESSPAAILGLTLLIIGFVLIFYGIASGIHYSRDRGYYMRELQKTSLVEDVLMDQRSAKRANNRKKNGKASS
jgi:uncharacterized membrane protein YiaA